MKKLNICRESYILFPAITLFVVLASCYLHHKRLQLQAPFPEKLAFYAE